MHKIFYITDNPYQDREQCPYLLIIAERHPPFIPAVLLLTLAEAEAAQAAGAIYYDPSIDIVRADLLAHTIYTRCKHDGRPESESRELARRAHIQAV